MENQQIEIGKVYKVKSVFSSAVKKMTVIAWNGGALIVQIGKTVEFHTVEHFGAIYTILN